MSYVCEFCAGDDPHTEIGGLYICGRCNMDENGHFPDHDQDMYVIHDAIEAIKEIGNTTLRDLIETGAPAKLNEAMDKIEYHGFFPPIRLSSLMWAYAQGRNDERTGKPRDKTPEWFREGGVEVADADSKS